MTGYLNLVTMLSMPVLHVTSPVLRAFAQYDDVFSFSYFKKTLFMLTKLVEKSVGTDMQKYRSESFMTIDHARERTLWCFWFLYGDSNGVERCQRVSRRKIGTDTSKCESYVSSLER